MLFGRIRDGIPHHAPRHCSPYSTRDGVIARLVAQSSLPGHSGTASPSPWALTSQDALVVVRWQARSATVTSPRGLKPASPTQAAFTSRFPPPGLADNRPVLIRGLLCSEVRCHQALASSLRHRHCISGAANGHANKACFRLPIARAHVARNAASEKLGGYFPPKNAHHGARTPRPRKAARVQDSLRPSAHAPPPSKLKGAPALRPPPPGNRRSRRSRLASRSPIPLN